MYDMLSDLKDGGTFLLNTEWSVEELDANLPASMKKYLAEHNIKFYIINGTDIAAEIGLGNRINTVLQAAFFKLANICLLYTSSNLIFSLSVFPDVL